MKQLIDAVTGFLLSPLQSKWPAGDLIAVAGIAVTLFLALLAAWAKRKERRTARLAEAPNVVVTFRRVPEKGTAVLQGYLSEYVVPTLENIGRNPAFDVECASEAWSDRADAAAAFHSSPVILQHLGAGDKVTLANHRAIRAEWNTTGRTWEDLPFAIYSYAIKFSDRTHRYVNAYCVSLFGFPDQITEDAVNDLAVQTVRLHETPLARLGRADRVRSMWESIARPVRRWRYRRRLMKQRATANRNLTGTAHE